MEESAIHFPSPLNQQATISNPPDQPFSAARTEIVAIAGASGVPGRERINNRPEFIPLLMNQFERKPDVPLPAASVVQGVEKRPPQGAFQPLTWPFPTVRRKERCLESC